jgi:hypothetical protein
MAVFSKSYRMERRVLPAFTEHKMGDRSHKFNENACMSRALIYAICMLLPWPEAARARAVSVAAVSLSHEEWVMAMVRFVDWPADARPAITDNTLVVCQPADAVPLDIGGRQVRGLTLQRLAVSKPAELDRCHVFSALSQRETDWLPWLAAIRAQPVLALGATARYCEVGGAICLVKDDKTATATFQLNLDTLARSGFKVRSPMLRPTRPRTPAVT